MSLKTPWAPVAFDWYADEEVKSPLLGPVLWPWLLGRIIKGGGVVSDVEMDPAEAVENLGLVRLGTELAAAVKSNPELDVQAWLSERAAETFLTYQTARSSRRQPLIVPAMSQRDLGGRNAEGGYGKNYQTKRGLTAKSFREWMGRFTRIEVTFLPSRAASSSSSSSPSGSFPPHSSSGSSGPLPPPHSSSSASQTPPGHHAQSDADAIRRFATLFQAWWPNVKLRHSFWLDNLALLQAHGEGAVAGLCPEARRRGATHPQYLIACLRNRPLGNTEPSQTSTTSGPAQRPAANRGSVPSQREWEANGW